MAQIINLNPINPTPTLQDKLFRESNRLSLAVNQNWQSDKALFQQLATFIWNNPFGATPQQALNTFGTRAGSLFVAASGYAAMYGIIAGAALPSAVPSDYTYVINNDGSVTVTQVQQAEVKPSVSAPAVVSKTVEPSEPVGFTIDEVSPEKVSGNVVISVPKGNPPRAFKKIGK